MFFQDNRTSEERRRDMAMADKCRAEGVLARGFLMKSVQPLLRKQGANVGLVSKGSLGCAELLVEVGGVTYKLTARVDHDD